MFFWNSLAFSMIQWMLAIWSLVPLPFLKPAWTSGSSRFTLNKIYLFTLNMESEGWQLLMMIPQLSNIQNLHNSLSFSLCSSQRTRGFSYLSKRVQNKWVKAISSEKWKASRKLHLILLPLTFYWPELCQMVTSRKEAMGGRSWVTQISKTVPAIQPWWKMTAIDLTENLIIITWGYVFLGRYFKVKFDSIYLPKELESIWSLKLSQHNDICNCSLYCSSSLFGNHSS